MFFEVYFCQNLSFWWWFCLFSIYGNGNDKFWWKKSHESLEKWNVDNSRRFSIIFFSIPKIIFAVIVTGSIMSLHSLSPSHSIVISLHSMMMLIALYTWKLRKSQNSPFIFPLASSSLCVPLKCHWKLHSETFRDVAVAFHWKMFAVDCAAGYWRFWLWNGVVKVDVFPRVGGKKLVNVLRKI